MPYYVRPMRKEDIAQVNEIDREAFPTQWPPPNYRHEIENQLAHYIVACDRSRPLGEPEPRPEKGLSGLTSRIRRWFNRDGPGESPPSDRHFIAGFAGIWIMADESHLTNIAVRARYQRQGLGELLLISVIELSARLKAEMVTLEVRVSNTPAQTLYYKYGFVQTGLRRAYYTDNREDAMLMSTEKITSPSYQARFQQLKQAHAQKWGAAERTLVSGPAQPDKR